MVSRAVVLAWAILLALPALAESSGKALRQGLVVTARRKSGEDAQRAAYSVERVGKNFRVTPLTGRARWFRTRTIKPGVAKSFGLAGLTMNVKNHGADVMVVVNQHSNVEVSPRVLVSLGNTLIGDLRVHTTVLKAIGNDLVGTASYPLDARLFPAQPFTLEGSKTGLLDDRTLEVTNISDAAR